MMFTQLKSMTRCDIGIDLGTANSVVYKENHGIIIREPSVVAFDQQSQSVLSIGDLVYEKWVKHRLNHCHSPIKRRCDF